MYMLHNSLAECICCIYIKDTWCYLILGMEIMPICTILIQSCTKMMDTVILGL